MKYRATNTARHVLDAIVLGFFLVLVEPTTAASQKAPEAGASRGQKSAVQKIFMVRAGIARPASGVLLYELLPSYSGSYKGASFRTNRWGMRDKDYELKPPPRTYRIALLGSSFSMGGGVPDEQTHEWLLEDRLNREGPGAPRRRYEILNFSVGGYGLLNNVAVADRKVFPFAPNAVLLVLHAPDGDRILADLARLQREGGQAEYPEVRQKLQEAGLRKGMEQPEVRRLLSRVGPDLLRWSLQRIARICREHGVPIVGIVSAEPRDPRAGRAEGSLAAIAAAATEAGIPLIDLKGVYDGHNFDKVHLPLDDGHLNVLGHRLVADRIYELLRENDARTLKLGFFAPR